MNALVDEIQHYGDHTFSEHKIKTIYFGGGTPSLLTVSQLSRIFDALQDAFIIDAEEITMEMNPDDVSVDYLNQLKDLGIQRASMGVQSFDRELLTFMHRAHNPEEAEQALEIIQKADFPSFTADLIYGNPGQTEEMLQKDINRLLAFDPPHISAYSLTIEPKTRLGKQIELGRIDKPEEDLVASHYDIVKNSLDDAGIRQYEISNFAKPGREAVHNSNYWRHVNYLGLGPSAHSLYWTGEGAKRWKNRSDLKQYLQKEWQTFREEVEHLTLESLAEERLMLGLRTIWGVSADQLKEKYQYRLSDTQWEWLREQEKRKCLELDDKTIRLTSKGLKIADYLILELITKHDS